MQESLFISFTLELAISLEGIGLLMGQLGITSIWKWPNQVRKIRTDQNLSERLGNSA